MYDFTSCFGYLSARAADSIPVESAQPVAVARVVVKPRPWARKPLLLEESEDYQRLVSALDPRGRLVDLLCGPTLQDPLGKARFCRKKLRKGRSPITPTLTHS